MLAGVELIVKAVRPTLGPLPRLVANQRIMSNDKPELLDSGGTIARRIIQLRNRDEDIGGMYIRQLLWHLQDTHGDGTTTAAVIFESIFRQGIHHVTSGSDAMMLRGYLEKGAKIIDGELDKMVTRLAGKKALSELAMTICSDREMANLLGEIFDIIGEYGRLELRSGNSMAIEREYIEGVYWDSGVSSRDSITDMASRRVTLDDSHVLITDLQVDDPQDLVPLLEDCTRAGVKNLGLIVSKISDRALGFLRANRAKINVVPVKPPAIRMDVRIGAMEDLEIMTGGKSLLSATNDSITQARAAHLGRVRRFWANFEFFGIVGGRGDAHQLRKHIGRLREALANIDDKDERKLLRERLGRLMGGSATLFVGGATPTEIDFRKALAERTAEAMRGAIAKGVLPGGGVALLDCQPALRQALSTAGEGEETVAYQILLKAVEAPIRAILQNAGFDDYDIMPELKHAGQGWGFDVIRREKVDMKKAGLHDAATVVKAAAYGAVHAAALALTTDVIIHRRILPEAIDTP